MRPYQASLRCTLNDSELLVITRVDFYRMFKQSQESWKNAVKQAKDKENEYLKRCRSYLDMNKLIVNKLKDVVTHADGNKLKISDEEMRIQLVKERENKGLFLRRFDKK